jgi:ATP-binding cassette subfamily C protein
VALLASFVKRYPWQSVFLVSALLLAGLADGLSLSALLPLLQLAFDAPGDDSELAQFVRDTLTQFELSPSIGALLIVMLIGVFIKNALVFVSTQRIGYIAADVATELRMNLLRAVTATRWEYYVNQSTGELANSMATEALRASNAYVYAVRLFAWPYSCRGRRP